jgi:hypothetical protein
MGGLRVWGPRLASLVVLAAAGAGCATSADPDDPVLQEALEAAEARGAEDDALDAALEQGLELGGRNLADDLTASELRCVEEHPDVLALDPREILTDPDAGAERATAMAAFIDCMDDPAANEGLIAQVEASLTLAVPQLDLSTDEAACMLERVLASSDDPAYTLAVGDRPSDVDLFLSSAQACFTDDNHAVLTGAAGAGPQAYGDDPRFDAMHDDCVDGDARACDLLWLQASEGSEYEEVGATCAGASPDGDVYCTPGLETGDDGIAPDGNVALPVLAADCEEGDLSACDLLFRVAPFGSELERIGSTCAGRVAVGALPDCRTRLG